MRTPDLWDKPEQEGLRNWTEDEAIENILDDMDEDPETIEICGYARMKLNIKPGHVLEDLLEWIDQDYGDPEEASEPTEAMKEAEKAFIEVVKREYAVWTCEEVCRKIINVKEWREK